MGKATFIALVHDLAAESTVEKIAAAHGPATRHQYELADGLLTLWTWTQIEEAAGRTGKILVKVNASRSSAVVPVPAQVVDQDAVPEGLLELVDQFCSYLYLDNQKRAVLWTDHVGFSKIFHAKIDGCRIFSDDLSVFRSLGFGVDRGMVASYLLNGLMLANRTLYEGVQSLASGKVIVATPHQLRERAYWSFEPSCEAGANGVDVAQGLWERTEAAILRHTGEHEVILPLSGGYDSTCILAVLAAAKRDISTFTYVNGVPQPDSDADVARRQAELVGVEHRVIGIESASFLGMLKANINAGLNMRNANYEISAYASVVESVTDHFKDPMFCFGEEIYGGPSYRLDSDNDILGSILLKSPRRLIELEPVLGQSAVDDLGGEVQHIYDSLFDSSLQGHSPKDVSDRLYFHVRLGLSAAPLRVYTAGCFLPFACPLLDIEVTDWIRFVSGRQRIEKRLFADIVRSKFPELFRIPRSRFDQTDPDLGQMVRAEEAEIRKYMASLTVGVPGVMTPADLRALLTLVLAPKSSSPSAESPMRAILAAVRNVAKSALTSGVMPARLRTQLRLRTLNNFSWGPDAMTLFQRALQLAMTFERMKTGETPR